MFLKEKKKGFTLIELLVVISIIALLLAILLPTLARIKFSAKVVICKSNMKQWGLMNALYASDHEGKFPRQDFNGSGRNLWDVSKKFITFSGYYNAGGSENKTVTHEYGINEVEMKYCPLSSAGLVRDMESMMDQFGGFSLFIGYGWCVPRATGTTVFPPEFPTCESDRSVAVIPILVDVVMKNQGSADDMSDNGVLPVSNDLDALNSNMSGIYATHVRNGKLINTNLLFGDTHVETRLPRAIRNRYDDGALKNFF